LKNVCAYIHDLRTDAVKYVIAYILPVLEPPLPQGDD